MKRFSLALFTGAVAAVLFSGTAHAAPVPWKYDWSPSATQIDSDTSSSSFITLTNEPGRTVTTDGTFITTTNITVTSDAPTGFPDKFETGGNVSFKLKITDLSSFGSPSNTFTFTGTFNTTDPMFPSTISSESSNLQYKATGIQSVVQQIGDNEYNVSFYSFTPPGPPGSSNKGSIAYKVTVRNSDIQKAPEPSTMLLAGLGASFMGLGAWRKRRQQAALAKA